MGAYLARRLLWALPTLVGITLITFAALRLVPGDPLAGGGDLHAGAVSREAVRAFRAQAGLDDPLPVAYARWAGRVATFDLGASFRTGRPVADTIGERLPVTLGLGAAALALVYLLGVPLGVAAALRQGRLADRAIAGALFALYAVPPFWAGTMALLLLGGGKYLDLIPIQGLASPEPMGAAARVLDVAWHAAAPVLLLAYGSLASVSRYVRSAMIEALASGHVRAARARGLPERTVILRHALRGALLPLVSHLGLMVPVLVGGSVIVERLFGLPGMGDLFYGALLARDLPVILGVTTVSALVTLAGVLVADLLYAAVDPRVALERA